MWILYAIAVLPMVVGFAVWLCTKRFVWQEWLLSTAIGFAMAGITHGIAVSSLLSDTETWSGQVTHVTHHPYWMAQWTETRSRTVGSGKHRRTEYYTVTCTKHHQEHWTATDTLDGSITISKSSFDDFKARLGGVVTTETPYKDNFHHGDRNVYSTYNTTKVVIPVQSRRTWENRVKHCPSVFQFPKVPADISVFAYPEARDHYQSNRLLGTAVAAIPILEWDKMNAVLGPNKKVNVIMVGFGDKDESIAHWQEAAWFGGKKNDVVICYGGPNDKPTWTYVFGWTEQEIAKKNLQSLVLEGPVDATILPKVTTEIRANYVIKDWKKFNYLTVEPPVWIFPVFLVIMVLAQAGYYIWAFSNDLHKK